MIHSIHIPPKAIHLPRISECRYTFIDRSEFMEFAISAYIHVGGSGYEAFYQFSLFDMKKAFREYVIENGVPSPTLFSTDLNEAVRLLIKTSKPHNRTKDESIWFDVFIKRHPAEFFYKKVESEVSKMVNDKYPNAIGMEKIESWKEIIYPDLIKNQS